METKNLNVGVYETTGTFKAIKKHSCVCFDDMTLVAVTGPAEDKESQEYAELFASALKTKLALVNLLTHVEMIEAIQGFEFELETEPFDIKAAMRQAADALGIELNHDAKDEIPF